MYFLSVFFFPSTFFFVHVYVHVCVHRNMHIHMCKTCNLFCIKLGWKNEVILVIITCILCFFLTTSLPLPSKELLNCFWEVLKDFSNEILGPALVFTFSIVLLILMVTLEASVPLNMPHLCCWGSFSKLSLLVTVMSLTAAVHSCCSRCPEAFSGDRSTAVPSEACVATKWGWAPVEGRVSAPWVQRTLL